MKKYTFIILAAALSFAACQEVEATMTEANILSAVIEQDEATKTVMDDNNNILWSANDQIIAFMKSSYGHKYNLIPSYVGKAYADFEPASSGNGGNLSAGSEWDHNVAYYPYSSSVECLKSGSNYTLDVVLPSEQTYVAESFGNGSMAMVAVSEDNDITFRNVLGGMKLQLRGTQTVKSISLQGKNNEKLSGAATVTAYTDETKPAITMDYGASKSVTLNCGNGVQLNEGKATEFIIALPPVLFSKGFTVTVTDVDGKTYTVETDKANTVLRSSLLVMPDLNLETSGEGAPRDYVDEYGINHGKGVAVGMAIWAPVNCGYHATDYQWGKLYQWGRKYGQGYDGDATTPELSEGGVSLQGGQSENNKNVFYTCPDSPYDWLYSQNDALWNSGTEDSPVKTEYDPCPTGWRVPTDAELRELYRNRSSWTENDLGQSGYWFSGPSSYSSEAAQVFFPAAGSRNGNFGNAFDRGYSGRYWSSRPYSYYAYYLYFGRGSAYMENNRRAFGYSVRCVQD